MVSPTYACIQVPAFTCSINNCTSCSSATTCALCEDGFYANSAGECVQYECSIAFCNSCSDNITCSGCLPAYQLVNNTCMWKSYACNVQNCVACLNNPENCAVCAEGYIPSGSTDSGTYCVPLTQSSPSPDVANCAVYGPMVPLTGSLTYGCVACNPNFFNVGGYCVANISMNYTCNIDNCVYCIQNNMCGKCA